MKYSNQALLIIGSGAWPQKISSIIRKNNKEILITILGAREFLGFNEEMVKNAIDNQIIWIATIPENQIKILKVLKPFSNKVIIEKPFAVTTTELNEVLNLSSDMSSKIYLSEPWRHSKIWADTKKLIKEQKIKQSIIINRGGPNERNYINPVWDWIQHDLGLIGELLVDYKAEVSSKYKWLNGGKTLRVNFIVKDRFDIEMNVGYFLERIETWEINQNTNINFANKLVQSDDPIYAMYEYVADDEFVNNLTDQVWLTSAVIKLLENTKS